MTGKWLGSALPVFLGAGCACGNERLSGAAKPNLIFILTDDQNFNELGITGNPVVKTPHLDRLAAEGTLFTEATVTSAVSTPSRASILTGMHERRHGINFNSGTALSPSAWLQTYPMLLRKAGYFLGYVGKNHVPIGAGGYETGLMDASYHFWYAGHSHLLFYPKERPIWALKVKGVDEQMFHNAQADTQVEIIQEGVENFLNPNQAFYDQAARFLEKRPKDRPFYLSINFNLPHDAGTSTMEDRPSDPELYKTGYRNRRDAVCGALPDTYIAKADIGTPRLPADVLYAQYRQAGYDYVDARETMVERMIRRYQTITGIDRFVGALREQLEQLQLAENTIIVFTSDHGMMTGEFGLGGKALNYEACLRVPLIVYDPRGGLRGQRRAEAVQLIDIAPTLLDYAGMETPGAMSGSSLAPLVRGDHVPWRTYAFSENLWCTYFGNPRIESIRGNGWKYIRYFKVDRSLFESSTEGVARFLVSNKLAEAYQHWLDASIHGERPVYEELFHLETDPGEKVNLATDPAYADRLNELREICQKMVEEARGAADVRPRLLQLEHERLEYYVKPE